MEKKITDGSKILLSMNGKAEFCVHFFGDTKQTKSCHSPCVLTEVESWEILLVWYSIDNMSLCFLAPFSLSFNNALFAYSAQISLAKTLYLPHKTHYLS
jgi:hypothetical protein